MPAEARCQANRGINAVGFRKPTKYCDSFRFLKLFCVHFSWDGTPSLTSDAITEYLFFVSSFETAVCISFIVIKVPPRSLIHQAAFLHFSQMLNLAP